MQYVHKPIRIDAVQLKNKTIITMDDGEEIEVAPGDWLIETDEGEQIVMNDDDFKRKYEPYTGVTSRIPSKITAREAFELFEEQSKSPGTPNEMLYQTPQTTPDKWGGMPQLIPSTPPPSCVNSVPKSPVKKKKKGGLFGMFGSKKKKSKESDENRFEQENIQCV
jgi:hypothetical protein